MAKAIHTAIVAALLLATSSCDPPRTTYIAVFCDLSLSTHKEGFLAQVLQIGRDLPRPGTIGLFALHGQTNNAEPILIDRKDRGNSTREENQQDKALSDHINTNLTSEEKHVGQYQTRTCILDSLRRASDFNNVQDGGALTMIYMSDMIEDCDRDHFPSVHGTGAVDAAMNSRFGGDYKRYIKLDGAKIVVCRSLKPVDPKLTLSAAEDGPMRSWNPSEIESFWAKAFESVGAIAPLWTDTAQCGAVVKSSLVAANSPNNR